MSHWPLGIYRSSGSVQASAEILYLPTPQGPLPVAAEIDGQLYAIEADHLPPRRLTNAQGQGVWQWITSGFGEVPASHGGNGFVLEAEGSSSGPNLGPAVDFALRYPGQVHDTETGLHYDHHRYYDPYLTVGYAEADPIGLNGGWNRFSYVDGDPLAAVDPQGLAPNQACVAAATAAGGALGGFLGSCAGGVIGGVAGGAAGSLASPGAGTVGGGAAGAVAGGRAGGVIGAAAGAAAGNAAGEALCPEQCPPCTPYPVGTIGFQGPKKAVIGKDGTRAGTRVEHYILFEVQQNPNNCKCRWQQMDRIAGHHYYHQPNIFYAINLNGKGRPPSYP